MVVELTRLPDDRRTVELTATGPDWASRLTGLLAQSYGSG